ncbi:putative membrane protein YdjX (TVP38/TMEM64 family) [Natronobacillus azotifigens]|uniref:TVP38/TMEM64 family membrane protein n=1 Tax=Natronobacillus azotifigens TaxID=472978 RepID=A0A9J6RAU0_9BACI|nr:VTT domain-containing protein [Natronobacillus azotifigens]MCZ0702655.1 VTT domain-containing protein [Natronobacillus azotifigens]
MHQFDQSLEAFIDGAGWFAPILFIILHVVRPLFFIPVIVICIAGGVLFGFVEGAILSLIGLSLMSLISYKLVHRFPKFKKNLTRLKEKIFYDRSLTVAQVMMLRIMPFIHFHLLSLYLMEMTKSLKEYMYYSILGLILPAIVYTGFGEAITALPWYITLCLLLVLAGAFKSIDIWNKSHI